MTSTNANQTETSGMSTSVGIADNATVTKNPSNMTMTTNENMTGTSTKMTEKPTNMTMTMVTPKEQVASGVQPKDVKCESGFELILNQFNSRPACVKSDVASMLVERGWGMLVSGSP